MYCNNIKNEMYIYIQVVSRYTITIYNTQGYPYTRDKVIHQARIDICPFFRAEVWAVLLGVKVSNMCIRYVYMHEHVHVCNSFVKIVIHTVLS